MTLQARYRTLFISDLHLGTRGCQAELFLDFLRHHDADTIYLVGDIIDGWQLKRSWYWPEAHDAIVQTLLRKARTGTRVIFLPGNHDEFARAFVGLTMGGIAVLRSASHTTADGRRFHITHGDEYDVVIRRARWLAYVGARAYRLALFGNRQLNLIRRKLGLSYWSFSAWAKSKVKTAVNFIGAFEKTLSDHASRSAYDGVICGHIHHAAIRDLNGVTYINIGDFVESCTVAAETFDGTIEIVTWMQPGTRTAVDAPEPFAEPEYA